jgi:hypothetical protein
MTGFSIIYHVILESALTILLAGILLYLLRVRKEKSQASHRGWNWIIAGFSLLLFASVLDITEQFDSLNRFVVIGNTAPQAFLKEFVGYFGGTLALAIGFVRWIPGVQELTGEIAERKRAEDLLRDAIESMEEGFTL